MLLPSNFPIGAIMGGIYTVIILTSVMALAEPTISDNRQKKPDFWNEPPSSCQRYRFGALRNCGYEYETVFADGKWHHGPIHFRYQGGQRWFWWRGEWRLDEWRGPPRGRHYP
jgi:hypothetical protein